MRILTAVILLSIGLGVSAQNQSAKEVEPAKASTVVKKKKQPAKKKKAEKQKVAVESTEGKLQAIYNQYMADELTPAQYHQQRAKIIAESRNK